MKWKSLIGVALLWAAVILGIEWVWGLVFLMWLIPDLMSGDTYFLEYISRKENPISYWLIMGSWLIFSVWILVLG